MSWSVESLEASVVDERERDGAVATDVELMLELALPFLWRLGLDRSVRNAGKTGSAKEERI